MSFLAEAFRLIVAALALLAAIVILAVGIAGIARWYRDRDFR